MVLLRWRPRLSIPKAELHFRERALLKRERALLKREQLLDAREAELRGHQLLSSELVGEDNHAAVAASAEHGIADTAAAEHGQPGSVSQVCDELSEDKENLDAELAKTIGRAIDHLDAAEMAGGAELVRETREFIQQGCIDGAANALLCILPISKGLDNTDETSSLFEAVKAAERFVRDTFILYARYNNPDRDIFLEIVQAALGRQLVGITRDDNQEDFDLRSVLLLSYWKVSKNKNKFPSNAEKVTRRRGHPRSRKPKKLAASDASAACGAAEPKVLLGPDTEHCCRACHRDEALLQSMPWPLVEFSELEPCYVPILSSDQGNVLFPRVNEQESGASSSWEARVLGVPPS